MLIKIADWFRRLDKETLELSYRFFMKGASTGNMNTFLKDVFRRELKEPNPTEEKKSVPPLVLDAEIVPETQR